MKAEDMPTPETDEVFRMSSSYTLAPSLLDKGRELEQRLAVQTALAESLAAKAQSLRLLVERAVEYARHKESCRLMGKIPKWHDFNRGPGYTGGCSCGLDALLAEIRERKARRDDE